jgi:hypothetical protein
MESMVIATYDHAVVVGEIQHKAHCPMEHIGGFMQSH